MANLLPNIIEITNKNYFKLSPYSNMGDLQQHELRIGFSQIQADMRGERYIHNSCTYCSDRGYSL